VTFSRAKHELLYKNTYKGAEADGVSDDVSDGRGVCGCGGIGSRSLAGTASQQRRLLA
jgi:hypothetical protein